MQDSFKNLVLQKIANILQSAEEYAARIARMKQVSDKYKLAVNVPGRQQAMAEAKKLLPKKADYEALGNHNSTPLNTLADGKPVPQSEVDKGMKVEEEHINAAVPTEAVKKELTKRIAKDHLAESPKYYEELEKMENKLKKKANVPGLETEPELRRNLANNASLALYGTLGNIGAVHGGGNIGIGPAVGGISGGSAIHSLADYLMHQYAREAMFNKPYIRYPLAYLAGSAGSYSLPRLAIEHLKAQKDLVDSAGEQPQVPYASGRPATPISNRVDAPEQPRSTPNHQ